MTNIAIIGNTMAGIKFAEAMKASSSSINIILFTLGRGRPYARPLLPGYCAGQISDEEMFTRPKDFAQKSGFLRVDQKVIRVNLKKGVVVTEDKQNFEYDILVVTDAELPQRGDPREINGLRGP